MKAIFMVGEQRSGSNLLRLIMNQSPDIAAPHPPHILQRMMPLLNLYGDLGNEQRFMDLVNDVCSLVEHNPVTWNGVVLDRDEVRNNCRENSLIAVYGAVMDQYAYAHGANSWVCKSMQNIRWATQLDEYFNEAKYIYLYRDPRDVALSFSKAVIGDKHPYFVAQKWSRLQEMCLLHRKRVVDSRFFSVCYEELTTNTESVVKDLCNFLDIDFTEQMLSFHCSDEASRTAQSSDLWGNLTQPVMNNNTKKFLDAMSTEDIRTVEAVAGHVMDELGYERCYVKPHQHIEFTTSQIDHFRKLNQLSIDEREKTANPEDVLRRQKQSKLLSNIKMRLKSMATVSDMGNEAGAFV